MRKRIIALIAVLLVMSCFLLSSCQSDADTDLPTGNGNAGNMGGENTGTSSGLKIELDQNNPFYVVTGIGTCTDKTVYIPSDYNGLPVKAIGEEAFENCTSFQKIVIPDSVLEIRDEAFRKCTSVEYVELLADEMQKIGEDAFLGCKSLKQIKMPKQLNKLEEGAFHACISLESIEIPSGLLTIPQACFNGCYKMTTITVPEGVTTLGTSSIAYCESLTEINLPQSLLNIDGSFHNNPVLVSITIPKNVSYIHASSFQDCPQLRTIRYYGSQNIDYLKNELNSECEIIYCD